MIKIEDFINHYSRDGSCPAFQCLASLPNYSWPIYNGCRRFLCPTDWTYHLAHPNFFNSMLCPAKLRLVGEWPQPSRSNGKDFQPSSIQQTSCKGKWNIKSAKGVSKREKSETNKKQFRRQKNMSKSWSKYWYLINCRGIASISSRLLTNLIRGSINWSCSDMLSRHVLQSLSPEPSSPLMLK